LRLSAKNLTLALGLLIASQSALAADSEKLPDLVITATRNPQASDTILASTTVISRTDIETSQARDVVDVLRTQAGIDITRAGGEGQQVSVFVRGANSNHTLVLIDGVRVSSVHSGAVAWEHLPISQVERIEIVRGPRAALWGSEAIGGVIQIFTRRLHGPNLYAAFGSYGHKRGELGWGVDLRDQSFQINAGFIENQGFSAQNRNGFSFDPDHDGYRNRSISLAWGMDLNTFGRLDLRAFGYDATTEFDPGTSATAQKVISVDYAVQALGIEHRLTLGFEEDANKTRVFGSIFDSRRRTADYQASKTLGTVTLDAGLNYAHDAGTSFDRFSQSLNYADRRDNLGLYARAQIGMGTQQAEFALRKDHNSEFGSRVTGSVALGGAIRGPWSYRLSWGKGFRSPTLSEQFSPGFGSLFAGNPDLNPESSRSYEAGLIFQPAGGARLEWDAWRTRINQLIGFEGENFQAININRATITGSELRYRKRLGQWYLGSQITWQQPKNDQTGRFLLRRSRWKISTRTDLDVRADTSLGMEVSYVSRRQDFSVSLGDFLLINLHARYRLSRDWSLEAKIDNAGDKDFEYAAGFNTARLSGSLALRFEP